MITAIVQFDLPADVDRQKASEIFQRIAPLYREMEGLIHKYFCFSDEGKGAGIYLWKSREAAEKVYAGVWRERIKELYGVEPEIQYYEPLLVVDNTAGQIRSAA
ncbi:MAG TPA: monooxygenase [Alphaproteobacteria bacterium]|nr:monooxygenase [Alphaproteobacteria bacterium]